MSEAASASEFDFLHVIYVIGCLIGSRYQHRGHGRPEATGSTVLVWFPPHCCRVNASSVSCVQAKSILKTLDARSAARLSIDSTHHTFKCVRGLAGVVAAAIYNCPAASSSSLLFPSLARLSYVIDEGICFMTLSVKPYPQRLAFSFLDEIRAGFLDELHKDHGDA